MTIPIPSTLYLFPLVFGVLGLAFGGLFYFMLRKYANVGKEGTVEQEMQWIWLSIFAGVVCAVSFVMSVVFVCILFSAEYYEVYPN